jgi:signal transduction histidine kinase
MKLAPIGAVTMILAAPFVWNWSREMTHGAETSGQVLRAIDAFAMAESELHRDVLRARAGMLRNYDPLVAEVQALHTALEHIPDHGRLAAALDEEENLTERFKTANALLQNSLAYFELFSNGLAAHPGPLAEEVSKLTAAMLHLTLDTSPAAVTEVSAHLEGVSGVPFSAPEETLAAGLLAHGGLLRDMLPAVDNLLKSLFAIPGPLEEMRIRNRILEQQHAAELQARVARYILVLISILLFASLGQLGLQLRSRALVLRRRAALEHLIAKISTRFINLQPRELQPLIELSLAELAHFIHADRAYFLVEGPQPQLYDWCARGVSFPPGWPEGAIPLTHTASIDHRGVIEFRATRAQPGPSTLVETLSAAGIHTWLCVPSKGGESLGSLLAFDSIGTHQIMRSNDLSLLRMAFDAMSNAVQRRALEQDRERLEANLQHARRMETIGALTSGIAHNFNNIVGAILGFTESAQLELPTDAHTSGSLNEIRRAGERARELVNQILTFGRRRRLRRARIFVRDWIQEASTLLEATLPSHIRLVVRERAGEISICGELVSLQQVILNVCNNAAQAMDLPGTIQLETDLRDVGRGGPAELAPGQYLVISVLDPGHGMDETTLERVFEPFFTTRAEGNGLGLALVREVVSEHAGTVRIRSILGAGTQVEIWLPTLATTQCSPANDTFGSTDRGNGERVLIVEPNPERLRRHEEIVAALGYEPVGFTDAAEAETACLADPTQFDAALYCARLQDGPVVFDQAARLAKKARHLPILLASTSLGDLAAAALAEAGITEILRQPLNSAELASVLARTIVNRTNTLRSPAGFVAVPTS